MLEIVAETGSTNSDLAARLSEGETVPESHWLIADRQNAGRGRQGRVWNDGLGNFMGSTVVHPTADDPPSSTLALLAGLALFETAAPLVSPASQPLLKWPNDLMVGSAKLAGILLESVAGSVVVGIGVNLAQAPKVADRETVALSQLGPPPARDHFAEQLARQWQTELHRWRTYGLPPLLSRWQAAAHPLGTRLSTHAAGDGRIEGVFDGLAEDGSAMLRLDNGERRAIHAGEISFA